VIDATDAFEPPGPGGWKRLGDHFPGALTAEYRALYSETCPPGMASYLERYGVLARTIDVAFVHGHLYITPVPLAGPRQISRTPPHAAVWLLSRLHPGFRRRNRAAARALAERPWRDVAARWFDRERSEWRARSQALQDEDPASMDADRLSDHLHRCRDLAGAGYRRHFELHGDDLLPIGLLFARCEEWGVDPTVAATAIAGASPPPTATGEPPAWQLVTGYDLDSLAWCELDHRRPVEPPAAHALIDLHDRVPSEHHEELDGLVADARAAVPLRDDNGVYTAAWPVGLLRRVMLEVGRRIGLHDEQHAVELTVAELDTRLHGAATPPADEAAARAATRRVDSARPAPATLGPEFAIPPLSALPRPLALIGAAQVAAADHMVEREDAAAAAVGADAYTGRALVVDDPTDAFDLIEPGDVVITTATSPTWNVVLGEAGAIVTSSGGLLSHAAVLARELGIPALIGAGPVQERIRTGMTVTVDPTAGTVTAA